MIEIAFRRAPSKVVAPMRIVGTEHRLGDRGGQDKSRKVRPVGRLGNVSNFSHAPNLAKNWLTLQIFPGRCSSSVFDTLRQSR